jgi:hypothetical protein
MALLSSTPPLLFCTFRASGLNAGAEPSALEVQLGVVSPVLRAPANRVNEGEGGGAGNATHPTDLDE